MLKQRARSPSSSSATCRDDHCKRSSDPFVPSLRKLASSTARTAALQDSICLLDNSAPPPTTSADEQYAETIKVIAKERRTLRQLVAKRDSTIHRLKTKISVLKETISTQAEQLQILEEKARGKTSKGMATPTSATTTTSRRKKETGLLPHLPGWTPPSRSASMDSLHPSLSTA
ncbi:hypothetical protein QYE76_002582 [Lolium multiflorum]|uniref:Uncharacterized protein n=1 Tax=Lolium multiflorum TaxID=4521 RepID=A0AAD8RP73_LOLMU|nr:hypothetical protein QYE76_002582 [Lolium multiflorum]